MNALTYARHDDDRDLDRILRLVNIIRCYERLVFDLLICRRPKGRNDAWSEASIRYVLAQHDYDTSKAAEELGIQRGRLYYYMQKYGIKTSKAQRPREA